MLDYIILPFQHCASYKYKKLTWNEIGVKWKRAIRSRSLSPGRFSPLFLLSSVHFRFRFPLSLPDRLLLSILFLSLPPPAGGGSFRYLQLHRALQAPRASGVWLCKGNLKNNLFIHEVGRSNLIEYKKNRRSYEWRTIQSRSVLNFQLQKLYQRQPLAIFHAKTIIFKRMDNLRQRNHLFSAGFVGCFYLCFREDQSFTQSPMTFSLPSLEGSNIVYTEHCTLRCVSFKFNPIVR